MSPFIAAVAPYSLAPVEKRSRLESQLGALIEHHRKGCTPYARWVDAWPRRDGERFTLESCPFLPVTVFKEFVLKSTTQAVTRVESSATTSGKAARIYLDPATGKRQRLSASRILGDFIGSTRRPYLVFDEEAAARGSDGMIGARGAAILALAPFASEVFFVGRSVAGGEPTIDVDRLAEALSAVGDQAFLGYGFTYLLYQMHQRLRELGFAAPAAHPESVLLHSGGWKRLEALAVAPPIFQEAIAGLWGLPPQQVIDFYGLVEQVGIPYPDCSEGVKHTPYWAEVLIRRPDTLEPAGPGETGLIQLLNTLPLSAPNHSVLTEDLGELVRLDGCRCGRRGRAFRFRGRAPRSEIRGCSDVHRA